MTDIFAYVDAVSYSKKDMMRNTPNDSLAERDYSPYMTNRSLSYHADSIFQSNEMNLCGYIDNLLQFDYFINSLRKRKRFAKWSKPAQNRDLEAIMEYFGYGRAKAEDALKTLTTQDIAIVHKKIYRGGANNKNEQPQTDRGSGGDSS